ncbi:MAG: ABC transporter permease [Lachnospiraceae bacterium]|nr:ABC transporter permease [Lachnospiraceae bacterium]
MNKTALIIRKELYRVFGDKKMIISLYIIPVIVTMAIYMLVGKMTSAMTKDINDHTSLVTVVNATDDFKDAIEISGFSQNAEINYIDDATYADKKSSLDEEIRNSDLDMVVCLSADFEEIAEEYAAGGSVMPGMDIYYNDTNNYSSRAYSVFNKTVIDTYKNSLLTERYGDVDYLDVFNINTENICKESMENTQFIRMMLPYMVIMLLFAGVMSIGVDAIAGEKERGTLASMLISPVKRGEIAAGKLISMAILSSISAIVTTASMVAAFSFMGSDSTLSGIGFGGVSFSALQIIELLLIMLGLVLFYVSLVALVAVYSGNTKTASSAISPIYLVIIALGMVTMFRTGNSTPTYLYAVPVYGNALAVGDVCSGELTLVNFLVTFIGTVGLAGILTVLVTKAFNNEKLMFNA